jgi:hypothetical protein
MIPLLPSRKQRHLQGLDYSRVPFRQMKKNKEQDLCAESSKCHSVTLTTNFQWQRVRGVAFSLQP